MHLSRQIIPLIIWIPFRVFHYVYLSKNYYAELYQIQEDQQTIYENDEASLPFNKILELLKTFDFLKLENLYFFHFEYDSIKYDIGQQKHQQHI
jgi:hypothetical protein